ncbi:MAG: hypothetical protein AAFP77_08970 [Bacteroidota bacterium]
MLIKNGSSIKCFWQNSKFHFYIANPDTDDVVTIELEYLRQRANIGANTTIVFNSDSTFYCLQNDKGMISRSRLQTVPDVRSFYELFKIERIVPGNVLIRFTRYPEDDEKDDITTEFYFRREFEYHVNLDILERK